MCYKQTTTTRLLQLKCSIFLPNKYFELKNSWCAKPELLAINGVATFVMPFSISLNATHTHIKQMHICIHRHTHTHAQTHPHTSYRRKHTHAHTHTHTHTHTHNMCYVCVCACVCTWQSTRDFAYIAPRSTFSGFKSLRSRCHHPYIWQHV